MAKFTNYSFQLDGVADTTEVAADGLATGDYGSGNNKVFTISFWFKMLDLTANQGIFYWGVHQNYPYILLATDPTTSGALRLFTNGAWVNVTGSFVADTWYHFAITRTAGASGVSQTYFNGISNISSSGPGTNYEIYAEYLWLGFGYNGYSYIEVADLSIFDTVVSASTLYNSGTPTDLTGSSNLVSWWRMGEGATFPTIPDEVGSNTGTMTNMVAGDIDCTDAA